MQWFEDMESGATLTRTGLNALQEAIFAGTVKTVIVWKLDRIARSMREGINTLSKELSARIGEPEAVSRIIAAFRERKVQVGRLFPPLPEFLRVTIGTKAQMERFVAVFKEVTV